MDYNKLKISDTRTIEEVPFNVVSYHLPKFIKDLSLTISDDKDYYRVILGLVVDKTNTKRISNVKEVVPGSLWEASNSIPVEFSLGGNKLTNNPQEKLNKPTVTKDFTKLEYFWSIKKFDDLGGNVLYNFLVSSLNPMVKNKVFTKYSTGEELSDFVDVVLEDLAK